jgi:sulfatase modifying factor 1
MYRLSRVRLSASQLTPGTLTFFTKLQRSFSDRRRRRAPSLLRDRYGVPSTVMKRQGHAALGALGLLLTVWACGGSDSSGSPSCIVGASAVCGCTNGRQGAQVCEPNHQFGVCVCDDSPSGLGGEAGALPSGHGGAGATAIAGAGGLVGDGGQPETVGGAPATPRCGDNQLTAAESCDDGNTTSGDGCDATCKVEPSWVCAGTPSFCNRSCVKDGAKCGAASNADCCETKSVDAGMFLRNDNEGLPATISSFGLDTFEVTVGRFRAFVEAYPASRPKKGSGRNAHNAADTGWDSVWDASLPADKAGLLTSLNCGKPNVSWTDAPADHENFPVNCITWYEAEAFCIWDGGRLPTDAEWTYAASGGGEQRYYPWSVPSQNPFIDASFALYGGSELARVGSKPAKSNSKWGQADMAGSVWEWVQDWALEPIPDGTCVDCANLETSVARIYRGGAYNVQAMTLATANATNRGHGYPADQVDVLGTRCARNR